MKKILHPILLFAVIVGIYFYRDPLLKYLITATTTTACEEPIKYSIGTIDEEFGVTNQNVLSNAKKAAAIWNNQLGKELFIYDESGGLDINLAFDERQRLLVQANQNKQIIESTEEKLKISVEEYDKRAAALNDQVKELNEEIDYWNKQGGAPEEEYEELVRRQSQINSEIRKLNEYGKTLNKSSGDLNNQIDKMNEVINEFNTLLQETPEEGLYDPNYEKITVYFYDNETRFVHTLAHEFGHALGIDHTSNPLAIMYPITNDNFGLTEDDIQLLNAACSYRYPKFFNLLEKIRLEIRSYLN